ncbi:MAG: molybdenum cofactor biosynthesis protein MoaA [Thermoplasmata archaeon]|nr:MAG: molybdenum cofactor biosynthesis protein MoaA [Thermoplasmata archaeon]RLF35606.1 MAG: molybdenum cofactor biosynthesis protein MoaA [Thermoplasmata archaeon]
MYDPIKLAKKTEEIVIRGDKRKYYRFRGTRFYGGSATADTVGCNLRCVFCWSETPVRIPQNIGIFYSPEEVADRLLHIAGKHHFNIMRVSGAEPTIGRKHLISLLENLDGGPLFILETNGILLGSDPSYVKELSNFDNLHVRISLKGGNINEFRWLTNANRGFRYQIKALEYLRDFDVSFHASIVSVAIKKQEILGMFQKMGLDDVYIEWERIRMYPPTRSRLRKMGMLKHFL